MRKILNLSLNCNIYYYFCAQSSINSQKTIMNALLRFTIENFRSIAERKSIEIKPDSIKDEPRSNVVSTNEVPFLRSVAIYGANSSGKSNLINAIGCMSRLIVDSVKVNDEEELPYFPFSLNLVNDKKPTLYEVDAIISDVRYRYSFSNTDKRIIHEQLIRIEKSGTEKPLFIRNVDGIGVNEKLFPEGKDMEDKTNDNRLFLSLVGQLGGKISNTIIKFFNNDLNVLSGLETDGYSTYTRYLLNKNLPGCEDMKKFFSDMQLGFSGLSTKVRDFNINELPDNLPKELKESLAKELSGKKLVDVFSTHKVFNEEGQPIESKSFDFTEMESAGTQKLFDMAGPIFDTILRGSILVIDELDAKMHPLISREIVKLFNDPLRNQLGAQLIFTTHDTNLLSSNLLRRDQIWFTEKDQLERTDVYSMRHIVLPDGKKPRGDGNMERNYIKGRYGAIPYIRTSID